MADKIQYVCLSDLHLGGDASLLTASNVDRFDAGMSGRYPQSPLLAALARCLRALVGEDKPTLVLAGDTLEYALATPNRALIVFDQFLGEVGSLFREIIYLPGNHDHHVWEATRDVQYAEYIEGKWSASPKAIRVGDWFPRPWHSTYAMEPTPLTNRTLQTIIGRHQGLSDLKAKIVYPNFAVFDGKKGKCVLFSHGHYVEKVHLLVSRCKELLLGLPEPPDVEQLEANNFAWIDSFWSALGQTDDFGVQMRAVYEALLLPGGKRVLAQKIRRSPLFNKPVWRELLKPLTLLVPWIGPFEKARVDPITDEVREGIREYFGGYVIQQLVKERHDALRKLEDVQSGSRTVQEGVQAVLQRIAAFDPDPARTQYTLVFGHTHKPFGLEQEIGFGDGATALGSGVPPSRQSSRVAVYNTGGWVVESDKAQGDHGASVVLVSDELETVSLRMYDEGNTAATLEELSKEKASAFAKALESRMRKSPKEFEEFRGVLDAELPTRRQELRDGLEAFRQTAGKRKRCDFTSP